MSAEAIKEFVVSLGWANDSASERRMMDSIASATKQAVALGVALEGAAVAAVAAMQRISVAMEGTYRASKRIGDSVAHIDSFSYAVSQLQGTTRDAVASLTTFADKLREQPGLVARIASQFHVSARDAAGNWRSTSKVLEEIVNSPAFKKLDEPHQRAIASQLLGVNINTLRSIQDPRFAGFEAEADRTAASQGLNRDSAAAQAAEFERSWRAAFKSVDDLLQRLAQHFDEKWGSQVREFKSWLDANGPRISDTLDEIIDMLLDVGKSIGTALGVLTEWVKAGDKWLLQTTGINNGIEKLVAFIWLLNTALGALMAGPALRAMVGVLSMMGLGSVIGFVAGGAVAYEAAKAYSGVPGADEKAPEGAIEKGADAIDKWVGDKWRNRPKWMGGTGGGQAGGSIGKGGWWTQEREQHAVDYLKSQGVSELGAKALVSRWRNVEASGGPGSRNSIGAWGIAQWLGGRKNGIDGDADFDHQLAHVAKELHSSESRALGILNAAKTPWEASQGASAFERAEGWNAASNTDNFTARTAKGIASIGAARGGGGGFVGTANANEIANWHNHGGHGAYPGFAPAAPIGHSSNSVMYGGHNVNNSPSIVINGAGDAGATASAVSQVMKKANEDLLRNLHGAAH